jgi:hypothetical protein
MKHLSLLLLLTAMALAVPVATGAARAAGPCNPAIQPCL